MGLRVGEEVARTGEGVGSLTMMVVGCIEQVDGVSIG